MKKSIDLHEEIARVAHDLYEKRGRTDGSDLDDWLQAERIVMQSYQTKSAKVTVTPTKSKGRTKKKEQKSS